MARVTFFKIRIYDNETNEKWKNGFVINQVTIAGLYSSIMET